jgi:hypothetical protein
MLVALTCEELSAGLDQVATQLLGDAGIECPPVDTCCLALRLGITVAVDALQQSRARYVRLDSRRPARSRPTIFFRPDVRTEREQWAVAHEIGEHAAHRVFSAWGMDPREVLPREREMAANQLAGRLLAPTDWLAADGRRMNWDLLALKNRYATASHELLARRMLECGPPAIISMFDQGRLSFRRSNVPGRVPPLSPAEQRCWQEVHASGRPVRIEDGPIQVHGWPVHEPGWKREILRTEVDDVDW